MVSFANFDFSKNLKDTVAFLITTALTVNVLKLASP